MIPENTLMINKYFAKLGAQGRSGRCNITYNDHIVPPSCRLIRSLVLIKMISGHLFRAAFNNAFSSFNPWTRFSGLIPPTKLTR